MNNKTLSVISYLTIIGWLVAYRVHKDQAKRSTLVRYHLEQSLGLLIVSVILFVMISIMIVANANMIVVLPRSGWWN